MMWLNGSIIVCRRCSGAGAPTIFIHETELDQALAAAVSDTQGYCLLEVHLDPADRSPALQRLAERLARRL